MLIDEPETSLHPWAIAVLAKAIKQATEEWGKQVILATHSPVLISQFDPDQILTVEQEDGRTRITRLSEVEEIKDLLQEYAPGSLYMSEMVGAQSKLVDQSTPSECHDYLDMALFPDCSSGDWERGGTVPAEALPIARS